MNYESNQTGRKNLSKRDYYGIFEHVVKVYLDCKSLHPVSACTYDGKPSRKLQGVALDFICDVEITVATQLKTAELLAEWDRLLQSYLEENEEDEEPVKKGPVPKDQAILTDRVVSLMARAFLTRGLYPTKKYFVHVRQGSKRDCERAAA